MTAEQVARPLTRLVVVDPVGNFGGATRFLRRLLPAIRLGRPELAIAFHGDGESIRRDEIAGELEAVGVEVHELRSLHPPAWEHRPLWYRLAFKVRRRLPARGFVSPFDTAAMVAREISEAIQGADLAYFPWPHGAAVPHRAIPLVTTIHDLNFKHFFGAPVYDLDAMQLLDRRIGEWLARASVIASSRFMADEIARFYPASKTAAIVRLAPFATAQGDGPGEGNETLARFGLAPPYLLCPTHLTVHKNLGPLIAAFAVLRERFPTLRLVLTGNGTEMATGPATPIGSTRGGGTPDVIGLGYVSNAEIDDLIAGASAVVNSSLYEAGNGPGLDAWSRGTPVAMSDIPAFREHLSALGVEAALFDPRDPGDIAAKVADILDRPDAWAEAAARSKAAIGSRTWADVATEYLEVFDAAAAGNPHG